MKRNYGYKYYAYFTVGAKDTIQITELNGQVHTEVHVTEGKYEMLILWVLQQFVAGASLSCSMVDRYFQTCFPWISMYQSSPATVCKDYNCTTDLNCPILPNKSVYKSLDLKIIIIGDDRQL